MTNLNVFAKPAWGNLSNSQSHEFLLKWLDLACENLLKNCKCDRTLRLHNSLVLVIYQKHKIELCYLEF